MTAAPILQIDDEAMLEAQRQMALDDYGILDTPPEEGFDRLTRLAASLLDAPVALVSLLDGSRQWFKSRVGTEVTETPRAWAFCDHTIRQTGVFVVPDARADARFRDNPLVTGMPHIRFYAGAPLRTPTGEQIGSLCIIDSKPHQGLDERAQAVLRDLAALTVDEMELRRAAQVATDELMARRRSEGRLIAAHRAKNEFMASLAHEWGTPLNAIMGFAEVIEQQSFGRDAIDRYSEYARDIRTAGGHLLSMITEVLDHARIESGKVELALIDVDLREVVESAGRMVRGLAADRQVNLDLHLPQRPVMLTIDVLRIRQVLINLLTNAIKFTPSGGQVEARLEKAAGCAMMLIRDTGCGIPEDEIETVLLPFGRASNATRGIEGTGLGLPISKGFIELHGGRLTLQSRLGRGTEARVVLPTTD